MAPCNIIAFLARFCERLAEKTYAPALHALGARKKRGYDMPHSARLFLIYIYTRRDPTTLRAAHCARERVGMLPLLMLGYKCAKCNVRALFFFFILSRHYDSRAVREGIKTVRKPSNVRDAHAYMYTAFIGLAHRV